MYDSRIIRDGEHGDFLSNLLPQIRGTGELSYMTQSEIEVVNFDEVKNEYIQDMKLSVTPCSNGALYIDKEGKYYFVEFKNGKMNSKNPKEDGETQESPRVAIGKHFSAKAKKKFIRFDLEKFKTIYFKEADTFTEKEFMEKVVSFQ